MFCSVDFNIQGFRENRGRILFVVNDPVFFLSHRLPIAREAKELGFDVHVATPHEECVDKIINEGFVFHPVKLSKHGTSLFGELSTFLDIYRLFRRVKPSLVHLVTIKPVLYGGVAARLARVPAVVSAVPGVGILFVSSGGRNRVLRFFAQWAYRISLGHNNQRVIFQNPDDRCLFISNSLVDENNAVLISGSGVDMQKFSPGKTREGLPVVLLAGRMLWEKGVGNFVDAARIIKRRGPVARFVLVGNSVSWNASSISERQLYSWHDEGVVEWWGPQEDMPKIFAQTTIACLPSTYGEGVPKFLIEAAACGKPIVTTNTPGCREIVQDGANGILVPARDPEAVANAIGRLLDDSELRLQMGRRGRNIAVEGFAVGKVVRQTMAVYQRLLANVETLK